MRTLRRVHYRAGGPETGTTSIEYSLVALFVTVALIGGLTFLGGQVAALYNALPQAFHP